MIPINTKTKWGRVKAVGWVGERYYWMVDANGVVAMIPATTVESDHE